MLWNSTSPASTVCFVFRSKVGNVRSKTDKWWFRESMFFEVGLKVPFFLTPVFRWNLSVPSLCLDFVALDIRLYLYIKICIPFSSVYRWTRKLLIWTICFLLPTDSKVSSFSREGEGWIMRRYLWFHSNCGLLTRLQYSFSWVLHAFNYNWLSFLSDFHFWIALKLRKNVGFPDVIPARYCCVGGIEDKSKDL